MVVGKNKAQYNAAIHVIQTLDSDTHQGETLMDT